jgi:hypothetical protein
MQNVTLSLSEMTLNVNGTSYSLVPSDSTTPQTIPTMPTNSTGVCGTRMKSGKICNNTNCKVHKNLECVGCKKTLNRSAKMDCDCVYHNKCIKKAITQDHVCPNCGTEQSQETVDKIKNLGMNSIANLEKARAVKAEKVKEQETSDVIPSETKETPKATLKESKAVPRKTKDVKVTKRVQELTQELEQYSGIAETVNSEEIVEAIEQAVSDEDSDSELNMLIDELV